MTFEGPIDVHMWWDPLLNSKVHIQLVLWSMQGTLGNVLNIGENFFLQYECSFICTYPHHVYKVTFYINIDQFLGKSKWYDI